MANPIELKSGAGFSVEATFYSDAELTKEAKVDGVPEWTCDPDGAVDLEPSEDGMSMHGVVVATEALVAIVAVKADADRSEEVEYLFGTCEVHILPVEGKAAFVKLDATPD